MAHKRKHQAQLAFDALSVEGGLLSPEWLGRVAQLQAGHQTEADYRIEKGLNLRDEIGRFWRIAQAYWQEFNAGLAANADASTLSTQFVTQLLGKAFGFQSLRAVEPFTVAEKAYPVGHAALGPRCPVVVAPARGGVDAPLAEFGDENRKRSAFGLAQEYLNANEEALWGLATDGLTLRILRDNSSLTRPAWIEADLEAIFKEERYADFAALWLLLHETRFGALDKPPTDCVLETWRNAGKEEGTRARDHLRRGVEEALLALGQGFLAHPDNTKLRAALQEGSLTKEAYFQQLLRLVYRLIFLLTAEERGLLHPTGSKEDAKQLYAQGYSLRRMRERSAKRNAHDRFGDQWECLKIVFNGVAKGQPVLALPPLGGLFAVDQCPDLHAAKVENRSLLLAVFRLSWLREASGLVRVNWRDMGPEELGSVYESLLELVPQLTDGARIFGFASTDAARGNQRKGTGSYYTDDAIVQALLDSALEPVVRQRVAGASDPAAAVLGITVIDPACGSGHFLLAAARRLAAHVARLKTQGTPSAREYSAALRQVVGRCIFGVDRNPMALELARVALWLEAMVPDAPLTFMEHHLTCGDALIGLVSLQPLLNGIPQGAYKALEGDSTDAVSILKERNALGLKEAEKEAAHGQQVLGVADQTAAKWLALESLPDDTLEAIALKRQTHDRLRTEVTDTEARLALARDLFVAAFLARKEAGAEHTVPTTGDLLNALKGHTIRPGVAAAARAVCAEARVFHWRSGFSHIFAAGGFDVVLGNPPWDTLSPDAKEFFAQWEPAVRFQGPEEQAETIGRLTADPGIGKAWTQHCNELYAQVGFMKHSGRYALFAPGNLGKGDFNVYRMFVETALSIAKPGGRAAQVVPEGLYNGANCMAIRRHLFEETRLVSLVGFENARKRWFPDVDSRAKFVIYTAELGAKTESFAAAFCLKTDEQLLDARAGRNLLMMPVSMVREFSEDALAVMELGSQQDINIATRMFSRHPRFGDTTAAPPLREYMTEVHMGNDREIFAESPANGAVALYEGRMVAHYDYRAKGYREGRGRQAKWLDLPHGPGKSIQPQWYVPRADIPDKAHARMARYRVGFCDVASPTNERSLVAALIPPRVICGHKVPTILFPAGFDWAHAAWLGVANSFVMDFLARKKVALSMSYTVLDSLPFPRFRPTDILTRNIVKRVASLVCDGPEMSDFWTALARDGWVEPVAAAATPGLVDEEARQHVIAEIEVLVAAGCFGLVREDVAFVMDKFPIVKKRDIKTFGSFRTCERIMEAWDRLERTGELPEPVEPQA